MKTNQKKEAWWFKNHTSFLNNIRKPYRLICYKISIFSPILKYWPVFQSFKTYPIAQQSINWTIFIQLLRKHLRYDFDYKNWYTNQWLLGLQLMFGMPSDTPLHVSILNGTLPYGHYRTDGLWVNMNVSSLLDQYLVYLMPVIGTSRYDAVYKPSLVNFKNSPCEGLFVARYNLWNSAGSQSIPPVLSHR